MINSPTIDYSQLTVQNVCELINHILSGDNKKIVDSTKILKAFTKHKSSIKILANIVVNSHNVSHRQMSTVLLKRNLVNLYMGLTEDQKKEFRGILLNQYIKQTSIVIQRGIATLIGILLPVVELKNWVQLQALIDQALQSAPNSISTFILLNCLLYHFTPPKELYTYLFNALKVPALVDQSLKCITAVAETQDIDQSLAVELIKIWQVSGWHEETSINCLQVINIMAERRIKMNEQIIQWICQHVVGNKKLSHKFRILGLDFLTTYTEFNGKTLANKEKLLKKVVNTVCEVCSQPFGHSQDQQGDVQQIALWFIQTLSINLKSKKIYPVLLQSATNLINSQDIHKCNTGFLLLGSMAQGCAEKLKKNLQNPVMNVLIPKGLSSPAPQVRGAAINALSYFSQHLIPDIVEYHSTIIPSMINHIDDMSSKVAEKALIAIDVFFDNMEEQQINLYLPVVIPKLSQVVISEKSTPVMRNASMSGIGSAVQAACLNFQPYVQNVYNMCTEILKVGPSPQFNTVRAQNIEVIAKICNIFCKKSYGHRQQFYKTYAIPVMQPIYHILTTQNDPELRQSCFMFFYLLANAIQQQFSTIFDKIMPQVLKSARLKTPQSKKQQKKDFSLDSDSEDEGNFLNQIQISEYDEKAAAIRALGELANACPMKMVPYFEQAYKILDQHYQFFYDSVRVQVASCYVNLVKAFIKSQNGGVLPPYKCGLPVMQRYSQQIDKFFSNTIIPRLLFMINQQDSRRVISQTIESIHEMIKALGPACVDHSIQKIKQSIISLLQSQQAESDDEQQEHNHNHKHEEKQQEEEDDTDAYIFQPLCQDLIPTLSEVLQGAFLPPLSQIYPYMSKFLQERQNINDNIQMVGCISQCIKNVPSFFSNFAQQLFKNLATLSQLQDTDLNRNIAYCLAEAVEKSPESMKNYLEHTLLVLKNIYDHKDSHQACKDNTLAAICKIIMVFSPPMPYQLFINNLIQSMPFKGDQQQQNVALKCIINLSQKNPALIRPHAKQLILIIQNDLKDPKKYKIQGQLLQKLPSYLQALKSSQ